MPPRMPLLAAGVVQGFSAREFSRLHAPFVTAQPRGDFND